MAASASRGKLIVAAASDRGNTVSSERFEKIGEGGGRLFFFFFFFLINFRGFFVLFVTFFVLFVVLLLKNE